MAALTRDRNTPERPGDVFHLPMAAATEIFAGALVCRDSSGNAVPGSTATGLVPVGRAEMHVNNPGDAGDKHITVKRGVFRFANSAADDEITKAEVGQVAYIVDDQTVAKTSGSNTRSRAGFTADVDDEGVWVLLGYGLLSDPTGALLAANNLSDLVNAATARGNIGGGANKVIVQVPEIDLVGANEQVKRVVAPVAGDLALVQSVTSGALAAGDATLTVSINGVAVSTGAITIAQSGSAAGDVDSVEPDDDNTVAVGDVIEITVGGANTAEETADVAITITPSA